MIMPAADVGDVDVSAATLDHLQPRIEDVLSVLPAARVRLMDRHDEADRPPDAFVGHLRQRVSYERMPVAHADPDREIGLTLGQSGPETVRLATGNRGDGGDAAVLFVVVRHGVNPCRRNAPAAQHVSKEGPDFVESLRSAEADQEDACGSTV